MQKVEIDKDKPLQPGDIIELHFKTFGGTWLRATHIALIEWKLEGRTDFTVLSWQLPDHQTLIFEIRVEKTNPVLVTAAIIAGVIIAAGVVAWLTLDKVYQILDLPAGKIFAGGFGALAAVVAVVIVLGLLQKK